MCLGDSFVTFCHKMWSHFVVMWTRACYVSQHHFLSTFNNHVLSLHLQILTITQTVMRETEQRTGSPMMALRLCPSSMSLRRCPRSCVFGLMETLCPLYHRRAYFLGYVCMCVCVSCLKSCNTHEYLHSITLKLDECLGRQWIDSFDSLKKHL